MAEIFDAGSFNAEARKLSEEVARIAGQRNLDSAVVVAAMADIVAMVAAKAGPPTCKIGCTRFIIGWKKRITA